MSDIFIHGIKKVSLRDGTFKGKKGRYLIITAINENNEKNEIIIFPTEGKEMEVKNESSIIRASG